MEAVTLGERMAQSQNTKVDYNCKATSLQGLSTYGDVLVGDRAFEFYNEKNPQDYIQIPWDEVDHVSASVVFGKRVTRFAIFTRESGHFTFSTRDNKATLRAVREYVGAECMVRSASFIEVVGAGLARIGHVLASPFKR